MEHRPVIFVQKFGYLFYETAAVNLIKGTVSKRPKYLKKPKISRETRDSRELQSFRIFRNCSVVSKFFREPDVIWRNTKFSKISEYPEKSAIFFFLANLQ